MTFPGPFKQIVRLVSFSNGYPDRTDDRMMFSEYTPRVVHVQSLLVPLTIPGTKFITRLHVKCEVNSLTTARVVDVESPV